MSSTHTGSPARWAVSTEDSRAVGDDQEADPEHDCGPEDHEGKHGQNLEYDANEAGYRELGNSERGEQ